MKKIDRSVKSIADYEKRHPGETEGFGSKRELERALESKKPNALADQLGDPLYAVHEAVLGAVGAHRRSLLGDLALEIKERRA